MNNRIYVFGECSDACIMQLMSPDFFDRYGTPEICRKSNCFWFVPNHTEEPSIRHMLRCTTVFAPCDWQYDKKSRRLLRCAKFFGKRIIFGEDGRCR